MWHSLRFCLNVARVGVEIGMLVLPSLAQASLSSIGVGVSVSQPLGNAAQELNHPLGYVLDARWNGPSWLPESLDFHTDLSYQKYSIQNLDSAELSFVSFFAGPQVTGGAAFWGMVPSFSIEVGGVHDSLGFSGVTGGTSNSATRFGLQFLPALDIPVFHQLGAVIALPMTIVFQTATLGIWSSSFSLRWAL
ncbi:hypothetical protein WDW37_15355, partial [Bdellovibrionota bacterium FG-1]